MYMYHVLINAQSIHTIHINLNTIFYAHVEHSPTKKCTYGIIWKRLHARTQDWPESLENMQIFPFTGFVWWFCRYFYNRSKKIAPNLGSSGASSLITNEKHTKSSSCGIVDTSSTHVGLVHHRLLDTKWWHSCDFITFKRQFFLKQAINWL